MTKGALDMPAWIDADDARQKAAFRRGYRLGLTGKPQPESGDNFMIVHAGWKSGRAARADRLAAREARASMRARRNRGTQ